MGSKITNVSLILETEWLIVDALQQLSVNDKNLFMFSLPLINKNMEFFAVRFYYHFLQTKAGFLFKNTKIEQQYKMFGASLNIILTYISDPDLLENHMRILAKSHVEYGVIIDYIEDFIDAFMKALEETLSQKVNKHVLDIWKILISEIMTLFKIYLE